MSLQLLKSGLLKTSPLKTSSPETGSLETGPLETGLNQTSDKIEPTLDTSFTGASGIDSQTTTDAAASGSAVASVTATSFISSIKNFSLAFSSLRKDQLRVFMHPDQLVFIRIKRNRHQHIIHKKILPCTPPSQAAEPAELSWAHLIRAMQEELRDASWHGTRWNSPRLQLVLSNHFVHYAVIPWHASLSNRVERQAFLRHSVALAYGNTARNWDVRMSDSGVNRPALASGIDLALLRDLENSVKESNIQLGGIYPHLMVAINQARQQMQTNPYASYWFAMLESGRWCVALIQDGNWHSVKTFAASNTEATNTEAYGDNAAHDTRTQLTAYLARESVLSGIAGQNLPAVVYRPGHTPSFNTLADGRAVMWINTGQVRMLNAKKLNSADYADQAYNPGSQTSVGQHLASYETVLWA